MAGIAHNFGNPTVLSASGVVAGRPAAILSFTCATSSSGTIALYDNATTNSGTNFLLTTPVTAGQTLLLLMSTTNGCYAVLANCTGTFVWLPEA